nr:helix-turn-helix transcriptional regulator [Anaerovorax sp. IOR16]
MISLGITQKELANAIGLSYQYVRNILSGRMYSVQSKQKICNYLGIDADEENANT